LLTCAALPLLLGAAFLLIDSAALLLLSGAALLLVDGAALLLLLGGALLLVGRGALVLALRLREALGADPEKVGEYEKECFDWLYILSRRADEVAALAAAAIEGEGDGEGGGEKEESQARRLPHVFSTLLCYFLYSFRKSSTSQSACLINEAEIWQIVSEGGWFVSILCQKFGLVVQEEY
jgi:hypothetical protein